MKNLELKSPVNIQAELNKDYHVYLHDDNLSENSLKSDSETKVETTNPDINIEGVQVIDYSDRSIALIGETYNIAHILRKIGVFNKHLNIGGKRKWGWVVSKRLTNELSNLLNEAGVGL